MSRFALRLAVLAAVLATAGCCGRIAETSLVTDALTLPAGDHATGVPVDWFRTVDPGQEVPDGALPLCADRGRTDLLPLTFAVVEVGEHRAAVGGTSVQKLEQGRFPEGADGQPDLEPVRDAVEALRAAAREIALADCRPWIGGDRLPPVPFDTADEPPLLLALDHNVSALTALQAVDALHRAGARTIVVWVDDPDPGPAGDGAAAPDAGALIGVQLTADGASRSAAVDGARVLEDGSPDQIVGALGPALAAAVGEEPPPTAILDAGGGTLGDLVAAWDALAGAGVHCTTFAVSAPDAPTTGGPFPAGAGVQQIRTGDTVAVLPVLLPAVASGALDPGTDPLITGHPCPANVRFAVPQPQPAMIDAILEGFGVD